MGKNRILEGDVISHRMNRRTLESNKCRRLCLSGQTHGQRKKKRIADEERERV